MAKTDDIFDDLWDDAPSKQEPPSKTDSSDREDWDFLSDSPPPPRKKPPKKSGGILWIALAALLVIGILLLLPKNTSRPAPQISTPTLPPATQSSQPPQPTQAAEVQDGQPYRHFYQQLTDQEQTLFLQVLTALEAVEKTIGPLKFPDKRSLETIMEAIWYDCPEIFWYTGNYTYTYYTRSDYWEVTLTPSYHWDRQQAIQHKNFVDETLAPLLQQLKNLSDYEKVLGVHDFLIDRTAYTPSYLGTTLFEALHDKKAVCEGYTRVTQYALQQLDIPVIYVAGDATNSSGDRSAHAWTFAQVDGAWYLLDVTWDDPYLSNGQQKKLYTYFCVTTEEMARNHTPSLETFPRCTDTAANYYIRNDRYLSSYDTTTLQSWLATAAPDRSLSFKCADQSTYDQVMRLLKGSQFAELAQQAQVSVSNYSYHYDQVFYVVTVTW